MLPSAQRLKRRSSFGRVYAKGRSYVTDLVVVYVLPNRSSETRIGFSVSKKLGKAVKRNRVRRVLAEVVRLMMSEVAAGLDVVLVARVKAGKAEYGQVESAVRELFRKSGILTARDS